MAGDTLQVSNTCTGDTEIGKDLTIIGFGDQSILDGLGHGSVLSIDSGVTVLLGNLTITGGGGPFGGGINNSGTLTLQTITITGNSAAGAGGGIYNAGTVTLNDSGQGGSTVAGNTAGQGGGIYNSGQGSVILNNHSTVTDNTANFRDAANVGGGGIFNDGGTVTLNNSSSISNNSATAGDGGGGIDNEHGTVTLNQSSSITGNTSASNGGGIANRANGTVMMWGSSSITVNTATVPSSSIFPGGGGGIYDDATSSMTMQGSSSITGNTATGNTDFARGGGIFNECGGTLTGAVDGSNVKSNTPDQIFSIPPFNGSCWNRLKTEASSGRAPGTREPFRAGTARVYNRPAAVGARALAVSISTG